MRLLIAAGGSGGHLLPAQALAEQLEGAEVHFAGFALSKKPFFQKGRHPFTDIHASPRSPFAMGRGVMQSLRLLKRFKPDCVVGFGSYHSFPLLVAALVSGYPIVLYEPNCEMGRVNRLFAPFARAVALQLPTTRSLSNGQYVPLFPWKERRELPDQRAARGRYGLDPDRPTLLIFGGSQGASFLNQVVPEALRDSPYQVIHLRGHGAGPVSHFVPARDLEYEREMMWAYAAADLVIARAGAATVAELIQYEKPALLIPYPHAKGHQEANGRFLQEIGGAHMMRQEEASVERMAAWLKTPPLDVMKEKLQMYRTSRREVPWEELFRCITS